MVDPYFIDAVFFSVQQGRGKGAFSTFLLQGNPGLESRILGLTTANWNLYNFN
jgi:hypothetical protein